MTTGQTTVTPQGIKLGPYHIENPVFLAPMAGVTDAPFRQLCMEHGAGATVSEMVTSQSQFADSTKTKNRLHFPKTGIKIVQIVGSEPQQIADCARDNVHKGAQVIDINMGCPAKKVCKKAAGSALLKDPSLVQEILSTTVKAVEVPVTLKMRTGWDTSNRNGVEIAKIAEQAGISMLTVHGRTRACRFTGQVEYQTIKAIKKAVSIPVIANGDITSAAKACEVKNITGADGIMVGRAALGNPWIFQEINHFLNNGFVSSPPNRIQIVQTIYKHIKSLHEFYGDYLGVRISRKHFSWYFKNLQADDGIRDLFMAESTTNGQLALINKLIDVHLKAA